MNLTTTEKEKALKDLHEIPDTLHSIGRAADQLTKINVKLERIADALEDIAESLYRAYPERIHPAQKPTASTAPAPGELSDEDLRNILRRKRNTNSSGSGRGEVVEDQSGGEV